MQEETIYQTHDFLTLGSIPIKLHDRNGKCECCNAEAKWVELNVHYTIWLATNKLSYNLEAKKLKMLVCSLSLEYLG